MLLVLCEESDLSALWAADALRARGLRPYVLTGSVLAAAERWQHTVTGAGATSELTLAGGVQLDLARTRGVLNRLVQVPTAWARRVHGPDREYALQEMHAFYLSFLHALPGRKLNPPSPQGLAGNWRHPSAWAALAHQVGLPAKPYHQTSDEDPALHWQAVGAPAEAMVYVVGSRAVGASSLLGTLGAACVRLAEAANATLLGIEFNRNPESGVFEMCRASVTPDLIRGGDALADALAEELAA